MKTLQQHISLKNELQSLCDCINEKLFISKDARKEEITWDSFIEALLKHNDGTLELEENNIEIIVNPPDDLSSTILGKLKGCQITRIHALKHRDNKYYISLSIDSGFQSGLTITDIDDLRDVIGEEQLEQIYFMVS